jgi:hypothetical protein
MHVRRHHKPIPSILLAALFAPATMSAAWGAPPSLPPLMFQPYGFQQQLLPGQPEASFITPKPMAPMMPLFNMPASPFGELGHNLTGSPTQSVPHRQPISPDPLPGGSSRDAAAQRPTLLPAPGYTKGPAHRRPLGW